MACYGNERKGAATLYRAMGVTLSSHLHKVICNVSHPEQVVTVSVRCSTKTLSVHKIDVCCIETAVTRYSVYLLCGDSFLS